ncbi:unnamed protein product [Brassica rapa subsp. trilocularis]
MGLKESKNDDDEIVVDILECNDDDHTDDDDDDDVGSSASSSSFSGTVSERDETEETACNDQEADSIMCTDPLWVRKKKLTDHWRRFIHPITWRCKWLELKVRELQNQAGKYDRELQESCQAKQIELENLKSEEFGSLLQCRTERTRLKKRRKRKRVEEEEASDVSSYALNHNLFSYYENRKSFGDVALSDKKNKNSKEEEAVFCEETLLLEFGEGDAFLEQILLKIEAVKVEALNLKNRVDKVVNENPCRFSLEKQKQPLLVTKNEDDSEEKTVKSASVSEDDDETTDILLSEMMQREGKAIVLNKKTQKTEQASVEEGPSRPVRNRKPRNLEVKEETKTKRRRVSKEKPKSNVTKRPNKKRKRGKRRSGSSGSRRRS